MEQISIVTGSKSSYEKLLREMKNEVGSEITVESELNKISALNADEKTRSKIIKILSNIIIEEYENKIISKLIEQNYCYFSKVEKKDIFNNTLKYIINDNTYIMNYLQKRRNTLICKKLQEYLQSSNDVVLDGFINFRLKEYQNELEEIIDKAVDDFLVEKEYKEFVKLLKYFVSVQKPKHELVHIIAEDGNYKIYNNEKEEITKDCINEFIYDEAELKLRSDDILLSSLISIAPLKIIVHNKENIKNIELLNTITSVFYKNVSYCDGCDLCKKD